MTSPPQQVYQKVLECARDIYSHTEWESLRSHLITTLPKLISSSLTYYAATEPKTQSTYELVDQSKGAKIEKLQPAFEEHMKEAPIIRRSYGKAPGQVMKISDYLSQREFHETGLYHEYYKPLGLEDAMVVTLPAPPTVVSTLVLSRENRSFTEKDRALLQLLAPHIVQACLNAEKIENRLEISKQPLRLLESLDQGALLVAPDGTIHYATQQAQTSLTYYFPEYSNSPQKLPEPIKHWFSAQKEKWADSHSLATLTSYEIDQNEKRLEIQFAKNLVEKDFVLLLKEKSFAVPHQQLQSLGLSPREAEVLYWLAQGKTNPEVAMILNANPATIKKHVERILSKLGVENRSAATIKVIEVLGLPPA
ncbi:MAG: LuxR C-terminal-related transcriptional regulator [Verrucomicrobiae bacterium]|nr:LuxR C-terminal-related transcriptional regulator [Verrucomicrobiae bacterium]